MTKYKRKKVFNRTDFEKETEETKNPEIEKSETVLDKESNSTHQKLPTKPRITSGIKYAYITGIAALLSGVFTPFTLGHELQTIVSGMGELHLEIIMDRLKREYKVEGNRGNPRVAYREAITSSAKAEGKLVRQTGGHGQYGHVWLEVEPTKRGTGFEFEDKVRGGAIPREYISAVQHGVQDALNSGPLGGHPVVDVKVTVVDGSFHDVDA